MDCKKLAADSATLSDSTRLAFDRTRLAYDRTMMAWVRTATSMITFGFSVYKFFALSVEQSAPSSAVFGPREFALLLVGLGLFCLVAATLEYRSGMKQLRVQCPDVATSRLTSFVAIVLSLLGLLALLAVILGK